MDFKHVYAKQEERTTMNTEEKRKHLYILIDRMNEQQIAKLYQLIRGIFGKAF